MAILQPPHLYPWLAPFHPFLLITLITFTFWLFSNSKTRRPTTESQAFIRNAVLVFVFFEMVPALLQLDLKLFFQICTSWLPIIIVFCLLLGMIDSEDQIPKLLITVVIAVAWIMCQAQQVYSYSFESLLYGRLGAYGDYRGANDYGLLLTCSIPFILKLIEFYQNKLIKLMLYSMVPVCIYHIFLTGSRGSLTGATVALILSTNTKSDLFAGWSKVIMMIVALVMIGGGEMYLASVRGEGFFTRDASSESRLDAWAAAGRMLFDNPLGVGFNQSREYIMEYGMYRKMPPHNTYLKVAIEAGIPGFIAFITILYLILKHLMKLEYYYRRVEPQKKVAIIQALLYSLIAFMVNTSFSQKEDELLLYILLGCSARLISFESDVISKKMER